MNVPLVEARLRTMTTEAELEEKVGKILTSRDLNLLVTGPTKLLKPDGKPLLIYLPDAIPHGLRASTYPALHRIRSKTDNRGMASGSQRIVKAGTRSRTKPVMSSIIGYMEDVQPFGYCRLTAYTAKDVEGWDTVRPLFEWVGKQFAEVIPDRYRAQMQVVEHTHQDWVIPGTPYTTITVNNTYPTGVHTDKGDLDAGFSCLAVLRRGHYTGGVLTFPQFRVGVDMHDGDLLLMDAHEWHGNTAMRCGHCKEQLTEYGHHCAGVMEEDQVPERISVVHYFRTNMQRCGSFEDELRKGQQRAEARSLTAGDGNKTSVVS